MFILVGLGNKGRRYQKTRHNAGFLLVDYLESHPIEGLKAVKTDCLMNNSGNWLVKFLKNAPSRLLPPASFLLIAHDDLDMPLGAFKIQFGRGPRLHRGVLSVEQALGTKEFWRARIGVDNRKEALKLFSRPSGEEFVLKPFTRTEAPILAAVFPSIAAEITEIISHRQADS